MGDILAGSLAVKVSEGMRMSSRPLIGQEGDILAVKVSEPARMPPLLANHKP